MSDDYLIWRPIIKNPFFDGKRYRIGLNKKFCEEAIRRGVNRFLVKVGEQEIGMNVPSQKELKRKDKDKEFEDRPSLFENSPAMRIYYFNIS